jgi:opacity protein-like surface antigen
MRPLLAASLAAVALLAAAPASAQLSLELRGGAGAGSYGATSAGFQVVPQPAGSAALSWAFRPGVAAYAGYSGVEPVFTSQGLDAGVRLELPAGIWARGGLVLHSLSGESPAGEESTDAALGFGAGAGIGLRLGERLTLTPGLGYTRYGASGPSGDHPVAVVTADLGLRFSLTGPRR